MPSSAATPPGPSSSRFPSRARRSARCHRRRGPAAATASCFSPPLQRERATPYRGPAPSPSFRQRTALAHGPDRTIQIRQRAGRLHIGPHPPSGHADRDYLRVAFCPCCGAPATSAKPSVASSPPAETLRPDQHGQFLSGYTDKRVFFTYFECPNCSAKFCPTYYRQSQLDGLYGRQAENMALRSVGGT